MRIALHYKREEAIAAWREEIRINPEYNQVWHRIGMTSFELGKFEDAIDAFDRSLALDPKNTDFLFYRDIAVRGLKTSKKKNQDWEAISTSSALMVFLPA